MDRTYAQALAAVADRLGELVSRPADELAGIARCAERLQATAPDALVRSLARVAAQAAYLALGKVRDPAADFPYGCPPEELPW